MNNHVNLNVRVSRETHDQLLRYCSKTGEKKARAVRKAIVALPSSTVRLLSDWIEQTEPQDYLFLYHGEPVRQRYISERWRRVLERVRIGEDKRPMDLADRKLDVQALRVTYRSMTEGWMPRSALLDSMGHRSADVHDGYLRFLERQVEAVATAQGDMVDSVWATGS